LSLDRVLDGGLTYGQVGYGKSAATPDAAAWAGTNNSLDTLPSFLIAGCEYIQGSKDEDWAKRRFDRLVRMGRQMLAEDRDGNGLIEYALSGNSGSWPSSGRPANWWDTIGFGHEDAYANALAFRACSLMGEVAQSLGRKSEAEEFTAAARQIKSSYYRTFFNSQTGLLAGWKSADGKLHDYAFTFVNGIAISFGLIEEKEANAIMDRLMKKMAEVGYARFDLGLPGSLVPVRREDYTDGRRRFGGSTNEDGSDGFQIYENGGATPCHAYWTVKALYRLGRVAEARRIYYPMLKSFAEGSFQGFCADGLSKDWRSWSGDCHGYEGFLSDGYLALLAVEDDLAAGK
jgi:glycogen debranching enzyme